MKTTDDQPPADPWKEKLQASLKVQRPNKGRIVVAVLLLAAALVGFFVWWFYPRPPLAPLAIVAGDQLGVAERDVTLRAQVERVEGDTNALAGLEVVFVEGRQKPGAQPKLVSIKTDAKGSASCAWPLPADAGQSEFIARLVGDKSRAGAEDRGQLFIRPEQTTLVLVQVDLLTPSKDPLLRKEKSLELALPVGAGDALTALAKKKHQIVYVSFGAELSHDYQKLRGWLKFHSQSRLPAGPVLGRFSVPREELDSKPWQKLAARLKNEFKGPHLAIAGKVEVAQQFHAAGLTTYYLLGPPAELPAGVVRAEDWSELQRLLSK